MPLPKTVHFLAITFDENPMSQGRLVTHWAVLLMEDHFVAYTEVKEKSDIASVYICGKNPEGRGRSLDNNW